MAPALSIDIEQRIIQLRQEGLALGDIAGHLEVSLGTVNKASKLHEEYRERTDPSKKRTGRAEMLNDGDEWYLKSLLESNPPIYLDEIEWKLEGFPSQSQLYPASDSSDHKTSPEGTRSAGHRSK